jgi:hypothetical protein
MLSIEERFKDFAIRFLGGGRIYEFELALFADFLLSFTKDEPCQP